MSASNWQVYFRNHPDAFLAAAASAGLVAGLLSVGSGGRRRPQPVRADTELASDPDAGFDMPAVEPSRRFRDRGPKAREIADTWDHMPDALIGVAIAKALDVVAHYVPGFREHYDRRAHTS